MRLLLATDVTVRGGVDGYVLTLADCLKRRGDDVVLLLEETTASDLRTEAPRLGIDVRFARQYHRMHTPEQIRDDAIALLNELQPDGLHVTCGSPWSCLGLRDVATEYDLPVVITEQQVDEALALDSATRERVRASYLAALAVVFVSEGNRATMHRIVGLDGVRHCVIPNGVDVDRLRVQAKAVPSRPASGAARLITAARLAPEKTLHLLIEAVSFLPPSMVDTVNLFGEGPQHGDLQQLVRDLGLQSRVFIHPWSTRIIEHMAVHDLFVLPSRAEGMPYALLQAMAIGLPVVATDVAGSAEALMQGAAGILVPKGDSAALAEGIRCAVTNRAETIRRSYIAVERARSHYDLPPLLLKTVGLWGGVVNIASDQGQML